MRSTILAALAGAFLLLDPATGTAGESAATSGTPAPVHGVAMHGDLKYGPDFKHFEYVNPDAPKGGEARLSAVGTYDTLNPFTLKGVSAAGLGNLFESLTVQSQDEAFSEYGLLAESITMPEDRSWVAFTLRPEARWHDGKPVTPEDVIFSLNTLKTEGHPFYRAYYGSVAKAEKTDERTVRFTFEEAGENRELPLIIGQMPVLPKHYFEGREFGATTLEPPVGSGPYEIVGFEPGRFITYKRVADYWGADLPVNRGRHNLDVLRYDYYRDGTVALEAFKAGEYDFRLENVAKNWATAYDIPQVDNGLIVKEDIPHDRPTGMQGFVMNTRRPLFSDPRVRRALAFAFDFEWTNQTLFYGQYTRTESYYSNSELAAEGLPSARELELLDPLKDEVPAEVFEREYFAPSTAEKGGIRANLRQAVMLLREAGWSVKDGRLVNADGTPFSFEILLNQPTWERIALPFARNLERLGIDASVRTVDTAQYQNRVDNFDFDMIVDVFGQSLSPGNEQRDFWSSQAAQTPGSRNTTGIASPAVDQLVDAVIAAPTRDDLIARTRALDRVLLWNHLVVPHWHSRTFRVAFWNKFSRPEISPRYDLGFDTWWVDEDKAAKVRKARGR